MNKSEIVAKLEEAGIEHDPKSTKAVLLELLPEEGEKKTVIVDEAMLEANPELADQGIEVGDEIEASEEEDDSDSSEEEPKAKKGFKYEVYDKETYIRTYEDPALAKEFSGKVASRRVVEVKM